MAGQYQRAAVSEAEDQGNEVPTPDRSTRLPFRGTPPATAADAAPQTPEAKPAGITITFKDLAGGEVSSKLKSSTKLKKAMDAYAQRAQRDRMTLRFLFEGERLTDESSPDSLEMVDGDIVEVHTEQIGGGED